MSAYRRDDYANAEGFYAQLGTVFEGYSESVIERVTSPRTGLQRTCKFPPSIAEVVEACEREAGEQYRAKERQERFANRLPAPALLNGPTMEQKLCALFGIRGIPHGWDAIDVTRKAQQHGSDFPRIVDEMLDAETKKRARK